MKISELILKLEEALIIYGDIEVLHRMSDGQYQEIYPHVSKVGRFLDGTIKKVYNETYNFTKEHNVEDIVEV